MRKMNKVLSMLLMIVLVVALLPIKTEAATMKLNKKKVSLKAGNTCTIKVDTEEDAKNIIWSSSNKKVVAIKQIGKKAKIFAIKKGTAKITCTINGVKKTCKVTVKKNTNFSAKQVQNIMEGSLRAKGYITFVEGAQKDWDEGVYAEGVEKGWYTYEDIMEGAPSFGASNTILYVNKNNVYGCVKGLVTFYEKYFNDGGNKKYTKEFYFKYLGKSKKTGAYMYKCYF